MYSKLKMEQICTLTDKNCLQKPRNTIYKLLLGVWPIPTTVWTCSVWLYGFIYKDPYDSTEYVLCDLLVDLCLVVELAPLRHSKSALPNCLWANNERVLTLYLDLSLYLRWNPNLSVRCTVEICLNHWCIKNTLH